MRQSRESLFLGGRFSGQFFGDKDDWAVRPHGTFHSRKQILELFGDQFEIEYMQLDETYDEHSHFCPGKFSQVYHVVAKKILEE